MIMIMMMTMKEVEGGEDVEGVEEVEEEEGVDMVEDVEDGDDFRRESRSYLTDPVVVEEKRFRGLTCHRIEKKIE